MPKPHTFPTLLNEALSLNISKLKEWGYLSGKNQSGTVTWSTNGHRRGSISIHMNTTCSEPFIFLSYKWNDVSRDYRVQLIKVATNLGKGFLWFFVCPKTGKHCRKLYLISGYFYSRSAFNGCMYESQTYSKKARQMDKLFAAYYGIVNIYEQLYKKHLKKQYAGKPTKKYLRLTSQIKKVERIPVEAIERIMMF